jgi:hypothetical protein
VHALVVGVLDVLEEEPSKGLLLDRDDVVDRLATNGPSRAFREAVLPERRYPRIGARIARNPVFFLAEKLVALIEEHQAVHRGNESSSPG